MHKEEVTQITHTNYVFTEKEIRSRIVECGRDILEDTMPKIQDLIKLIEDRPLVLERKLEDVLSELGTMVSITYLLADEMPLTKIIEIVTEEPFIFLGDIMDKQTDNPNFTVVVESVNDRRTFIKGETLLNNC